MTIEELIASAERQSELAIDTAPAGYSSIYAQRAIARALTAIARMMHEEHVVEMMRHQVWIDPSKEIRVSTAFTGDIIEDL